MTKKLRYDSQLFTTLRCLVEEKMLFSGDHKLPYSCRDKLSRLHSRGYTRREGMRGYYTYKPTAQSIKLVKKMISEHEAKSDRENKKYSF